jgi:prevent-host-death family protein
MIDISKDIESLTTFKRDSASVVRHLRKTGRPVVLTVKGKAHAVIMDPRAYQLMADRLDTIESIRSGLAQAKQGLGRPVDEFFDELDAEK